MSYFEEIPEDIVHLISNKSGYYDLGSIIKAFNFLNTVKFWEKFFTHTENKVLLILEELGRRKDYDILAKMFKEWNNLNNLLDLDDIFELFMGALAQGDIIFARLLFNRFSDKFDLKMIVFEYLNEEIEPPEDVLCFLLTETFEGNKFKADVISASSETESSMKLIKEYSIRFNLEQMLKLFHEFHDRSELLNFLISEYHDEFTSLGYAKSFIEFILKLLRNDEENIPEVFGLLKRLYKLID